ncbi:MAG: VanZ family protein [Clostridia bacterium]|nr:VanZ family protein [Clostridia bacterium]
MNDEAQSRMIRQHRDRRLSLGIPVVISFLMALAVASLIFYFSSRPADASNSDSGRIIVFIARIFGYDVGSMPEAERILFLHKYNHAVRKAAHFSEFAALGFLVMHFLDLSADASSLYVGFGFLRRLTGAGDRQTYFRVIFSPRPVVIAVCFSVLYALSDEIHQIFIDGRAFGLADILIDSAGAVVGIAVCILFRTAAVGARKKKEKQTGTGG